MLVCVWVCVDVSVCMHVHINMHSVLVEVQVHMCFIWVSWVLGAAVCVGGCLSVCTYARAAVGMGVFVSVCVYVCAHTREFHAQSNS